MQIKMEHPATGDVPVNLIGSPMRLSETPTSYRMAPPLLGQHTDEVLSDVLGVSAGELAELRAAKVI
jgi:crotonobetainyl-CoA:carnitine CoA-transferase CaiB-like acyl-CoA transferase